MAIDVELKTLKQSNTTWPSTFKASNRFPIVANRVFATLEKAQQYVDDTAADASAYQGIILAVVQDTTPKNNGVYYVSAVAMAEGEKGSLVKVGGTETEVAADYAAAVELSKTLVVGQLIKVENEYADEENNVTYQKGFYIVEGAGVISALATSTGSDDEVGALKARVDAAEVDIQALEEAVAAIEVPVKDIMVGDESLVDENGIARIVFPTVDFTPYEKVADANLVRGRMDAAEDAIEALQGKDGEIAEAIEALQGKDTELAEAIASKVEKVNGERLMTDAEGAKLAAIEEGAEVNVIEVVKVNGVALTVAEADRSVDVIVPTAPVQGVAEGEKIISLEGDKLKSTLTLAYVPATDEANAVLRLQGINGEVVSSIDATAFVKDGMLSGAKLEGPKGDETGEKYLVLSFNTEAGKEDVRMDVTSLLDYYTAGDGLSLTGNAFAVKIDETTNKYLQVTTNGIAVSQAFLDKITELDNAVLAAAKEYADGLASNYDAAGAADGVKTYADATFELKGAAEAAETAAKEYADSLASNYDAAGAAGNVKTYADETFVKLEGFNEFTESMETKLNGIDEGAQVNVIEGVTVNGIESTVANKIANVKVEAKDIELGVAIKNGDEVKYAADTEVSVVLQGIQDAIRGAIAGGVNSISSGDKVISVNSADANNPVVSLITETASETTVAEGHIEMIKSDNGLYGVMYYDGDDAEK